MLGAFYTADDSYRCVVTATNDGEMLELSYAEDDHSRIVIYGRGGR
jgi:hypothetical protein